MADYTILLVFGTRPEAIKLFPLVAALRASRKVRLRICVTAQHRAMLDQMLSIADIAADIDLDIMRDEQPINETLARLIIALDKVLAEENPQRVLVHGDTLTALAAAQAAHNRKIPVGHVEAGLRSGDMHHPHPEEGNRKIIAAIADMHFAPTASAARALRAENIDAAQIYITGNTVIDALHATAARLAAEPHLAQGLDPLIERFHDKRLIIVTAHRRENIGAPMEQIARALAQIAKRGDVGLILPLHPNPQVQRSLRPFLEDCDNIALIEPLDYLHFVRLLSLSYLVVTDSGGIQEEASALGKPMLILRETSERREAIDANIAKLVKCNCQTIVDEVTNLLDNHTTYKAMAQTIDVFGNGTASTQIAHIIESKLSLPRDPR